MKIKCIFDNKEFKLKPQGTMEVGSIINRMTINTVKEYSIDEIKQNILSGKTIRPSYCAGKEEFWVSQQIFMIDIDNKPAKSKGMSDSDYEELCTDYLLKNHRTYNDIINHCEKINIIPSFIYTSFNHNEDNHHKMRLVFILDKEINDYNIAKKIQLYFMNIIGEVDEQCKNLNRIYYAGRNIVFDSGNVLDSNQIINDSKDIIVKGYNVSKKKEKYSEVLGVHNNIELGRTSLLSCTPKTPKLIQQNNDDYYTIKAINIRDIQYLKGKYGNGEKKIFETKQQFLDYIRKEINLGELLEFNYPKNIKCLFHDDNNNSASIFQADDGAWIYKCHSSKCNVTYNIIGVIERLAGFKSRPKTYKFIKEIFNLEIMETEWQKEQKEILQANMDILYGDIEFEENCVQTNKNINKVKHYLDRLIHIAMKNVYSEELTDKNGDVVFFASVDYICKEMGMSHNSLNKISQKLAVFAYHKLIKKLDDDEVPERFRKRAEAININYNKDNFSGNNRLRHINFFSIPSYTVNKYDEIEQRAINWKENHYTMKGVSREMFYRTEGKEIADEIYPQYKKVTETIDGENHIVDRTTTKKSDERTNNIAKAIYDLVEQYGYVTEKEVVYKLKFKYLYTTTENQIKKSLKEICDNYGFQRIRANKEIKEQYGIPGNGYPFIICRDDKL